MPTNPTDIIIEEWDPQHARWSGLLALVTQFNQREWFLEAKVLAFGVLLTQRRQGIGRKLQEALRRRAQDLGCDQIRSHSGGDNLENHQLKLSLGYGVYPIIRGEDRRGVYFILPLRQLE